MDQPVCDVVSLFTEDRIELYIRKFVEEYEHFKKLGFWDPANPIPKPFHLKEFFQTHFPEIPQICYQFARKKLQSKRAYKQLLHKNEFLNEEEKAEFLKQTLRFVRPGKVVTARSMAIELKLTEQELREITVQGNSSQMPPPAAPSAPATPPPAAPSPPPAQPTNQSPPIPSTSAPATPRPQVRKSGNCNYGDILSAMQR